MSERPWSSCRKIVKDSSQVGAVISETYRQPWSRGASADHTVCSSHVGDGDGADGDGDGDGVMIMRSGDGGV